MFGMYTFALVGAVCFGSARAVGGRRLIVAPHPTVHFGKTGPPQAEIYSTCLMHYPRENSHVMAQGRVNLEKCGLN